jgi:hypothetical protein
VSALQDAFEAKFPMPADCIRCGERYAATSFNAWAAHSYIEKFDGWRLGYTAASDEQAAKVAALKSTLEATKRAALAGMDAVNSACRIQYEEAARLRAESSPEALASERAANALLTDENERLRFTIARLEVQWNDAEKRAMLNHKKAEAARAAALDEAALAIEDHNRLGREWVPGSLWDNLQNEAAARVAALKEKA